MTDALTLVWQTMRARWRMLALVGLATAVLYQGVLLLALILRFGNLPNYAVAYDWPGNVWRIVEGTPSIRDMGPIIANEWLFEVGFMNYDYGNGISEWALSVVPAKMLVLFVMGALVGLAFALARSGACPAATVRSSGAATSLGAGLVLLTNATMSWVVCCATPSWVVGLAMMGVGVSTSLALEGIGGWVAGTGFTLLLASVAALAWIRSRPALVPGPSDVPAAS
ncbi:MAG: hypothetical protein AAF074_11845 [Pseudomonadota bacterium]